MFHLAREKKQSEEVAAEPDLADGKLRNQLANGAASGLGIELGPQSLFEFDPGTGVFAWSDQNFVAGVFGKETADSGLTAETLASFIVGQDAPSERAETLAGKAESYCCQFQIRRQDGAVGWYEERAGWIGVAGERRLIGVFRSVDRERQENESLSRLAELDELTGVLNRSTLGKRLNGFSTSANAESVERKGVYLVAGVDDVGGVNSDFGYAAADFVIREVSSRIVRVLNESGHEFSIGRVAGTKFGIVVDNVADNDVRDICVRLLNIVREDVIDTEKGSVAASICIGAIELGKSDLSSHMVMARAEAALDQAKRMGRSSWATFSETTDVVSMRKRNSKLSDVIITALNERRIHVAFQPIVSDMEEAPRKFECLVRMTDEDANEVPAPEFIPAAERLGLVHLLDRRVLELAINTLEQVPDIVLSVNISHETVRDPVWAEGYLSLLRANKHLAARVCVELTETRILDLEGAAIEFVAELKELGASFAMDDFGAGYTSFRNLKALDIDILKIDGSFVSGLSTSRDNQLFVRTLLDLARNFGMKTVAEWVDNEADAILLKGLGVDYLQGFLVGKPEIRPGWLKDGAPNEPPHLVGH